MQSLPDRHARLNPVADLTQKQRVTRAPPGRRHHHRVVPLPRRDMTLLSTGHRQDRLPIKPDAVTETLKKGYS